MSLRRISYESLFVYLLISFNILYADCITSEQNFSEISSFKNHPGSALLLPNLGVVTIRGNFGEGIGIKHDYETLNILCAFPLHFAFQPFVDLRYHYIKNNEWAANAGVGARWLSKSQNCILGTNFYYDYRQTRLFNYNQVGIGFEFFSKSCDLRVNAYLPFGKSHHVRRYVFDDYAGGYVAICNRKETAQKGFDAEISRVLWECRNLAFRAGIGLYYFKDTQGNKKRWGEKARAGLSWRSLINLEARIYRDPTQNVFFQGLIALSLPLDLCRLSFWENCEKSFYQPVQRNEMIVKHSRTCWNTNF